MMYRCNSQAVLDKARRSTDAELLAHFQKMRIPGHNLDHAMTQVLAERFEQLTTKKESAVPEGKHLKFKFLCMSSTQRTKVFEVTDFEETVILGVIKWHGPWRKYCFFPERSTLYDASCLSYIAHMCFDYTEKHKKKQAY